MDNYELIHWGIKGQRWGVRRYQNSDGSLTPAGKKRYEKEMGKLKAEEKVLKTKARTQAKIAKLDSKRQELEELRKQVNGDKDKKSKPDTKPAEKKLKDMSDEELLQRLERFKNEAKYREYTTSNGKKFMGDVLEKAGKNIATQVVTYALGAAANKFIGKMFNDPDMVNPKKGQKDK